MSRPALFCAMLLPASALAQTKDSTQNIDALYAELEALFSEESDSTLALFKMVDSLLMMDELRYHSLIFRTAYLGQVSTAGRAQDFSQNGYSTGISYFHPSNFFVDVSSFWNSGYEPAYYLTTTAVGYSKKYSRHWSTNLSHNFYFYNDTLSARFNKALQLGQYYDYKWLNLGVDYSLLYGGSTAHRLMLSANTSIKWDFNGWIKRLSISPGVSVMAGNADIVYLRQSETPIYDLYNILRQEPFPQLTNTEYAALAGLLYKERNGAAYLYLRRRGFTDEEIIGVLNEYETQQIKEDNVFGLMNYGFNLPVYAQAGKFNFMLNYTYNIPVSLPGESYKYEPSGFLSVAISYMLYWKN